MERGSLVGYSSWGHKELDTTEQLSTHTHIHTQMLNPWQLSTLLLLLSQLKLEVFFSSLQLAFLMLKVALCSICCAFEGQYCGTPEVD